MVEVWYRCVRVCVSVWCVITAGVWREPIEERERERERDVTAGKFRFGYKKDSDGYYD